MALEQELTTYRRELPRLLEQGEDGRYAVIRGDTLYATWDTFRDALQFGYDKFGADVPFMAQKVDARDVARMPPPAGVPPLAGAVAAFGGGK